MTRPEDLRGSPQDQAFKSASKIEARLRRRLIKSPDLKDLGLNYDIIPYHILLNLSNALIKSRSLTPLELISERNLDEELNAGRKALGYARKITGALWTLMRSEGAPEEDKAEYEKFYYIVAEKGEDPASGVIGTVKKDSNPPRDIYDPNQERVARAGSINLILFHMLGTQIVTEKLTNAVGQAASENLDMMGEEIQNKILNLVNLKPTEKVKRAISEAVTFAEVRTWSSYSAQVGVGAPFNHPNARSTNSDLDNKAT